MKIALVGYMGSGKSYWAKRLAESLSYPYVDLDIMLEEKALNMSIAEFIAKRGELAFRKIESATLNELASEEGDFVLATGGGTPCYYENMEVLNAYFRTIYLHNSVQDLYTRLQHDRQHRPLLAHIEDAALKEFIAKHLFERSYYYEKAHLRVNAASLTIDQLKQLSAHG